MDVFSGVITLLYTNKGFRRKENGMNEIEETKDKRVKDKRGNSNREEMIKSKRNCNKQP